MYGWLRNWNWTIKKAGKVHSPHTWFPRDEIISASVSNRHKGFLYLTSTIVTNELETTSWMLLNLEWTSGIVSSWNFDLSLLNRKCSTFFDEDLMNLFIVFTEEDDLIKFLIERIASNVLDYSREALILSQLLEVNGIIGREILVFWFYACELVNEAKWA